MNGRHRELLVMILGFTAVIWFAPKIAGWS
jgi:hypothetical protein